jgi:hypothetical protein
MAVLSNQPAPYRASSTASLKSGASQETSANAASELATAITVDHLWRETWNVPKPTKAGIVTPAHSFPIKGRSIWVPMHVQTVEEEQSEIKDARYMRYMGKLVKSFVVRGQTVTALTDLTARSTIPADLAVDDRRAAQEICHSLGAFVWARKNRQFGLENIKVTGSHGELLAYRFGLQGRVH